MYNSHITILCMCVYVCTYLRLLFCVFSNCSSLLASVAVGLCLVVLVPLLHSLLSHRTETMKENKIQADTALKGIYMRILTLSLIPDILQVKSKNKLV